MIQTLYEPFRCWSEKGSVYILSDPHFEDNKCKFIDPNWITPEKQVDIINDLVKKNDTFVCLGDVGNPKYVSMLKAGRKVLITGNHDKPGLYRSVFDEIYTGPLFIAEKVLLSHEPVHGLPWCLNIHGHDHSNMESYEEKRTEGSYGVLSELLNCKHINLAANVCGYTPVSLGALIKKGILADIPGIHRVTIDNATERKRNREDLDYEEI